MNYYVLGTDNGAIVMMSSRAFGTRQEAAEYADSCALSFRAFVVVECDYD